VAPSRPRANEWSSDPDPAWHDNDHKKDYDSPRATTTGHLPTSRCRLMRPR
jgi:hypothetical protein